MAYADRDRTGENVTAIIISALILATVGYLLVSGLAYNGVKALIKKVTTVDVKEPEKPKEPPPPPPKKVDVPPPVVPPVQINIAPTPPQIQTVTTPPPVAPLPVLAPPAAPPPPRFTAKAAVPKGNPGNWVTNDDYPSRALREEKQGVTGFRLSIGADGRVTGCDITSSSGSSELDSTACSLLTRRGRFSPATDGDGKPTTSSYSSRFRWVLQKE